MNSPQSLRTRNVGWFGCAQHERRRRRACCQLPYCAERGLRPGVPAVGREEARDRVRVGVVDLPAGERLRELLDVVLAVVRRAGVVDRAEREELHQLARVVLVRVRPSTFDSPVR